MDSSHFENNFKRTITCPTTRANMSEPSKRSSPVDTGVDFGGLNPPKQSSKPPQIETWYTINKWSFGQFYNVNPPKQTQSPLQNCKAPLLENFWRRFWSGGLTGVVIALWRTLFNNGEVFMRISHWLLHNKRHRATTLPARMKANGNFSDASVERFYSVSQNKSYGAP